METWKASLHIYLSMSLNGFTIVHQSIIVLWIKRYSLPFILNQIYESKGRAANVLLGRDIRTFFCGMDIWESLWECISPTIVFIFLPYAIGVRLWNKQRLFSVCLLASQLNSTSKPYIFSLVYLCQKMRNSYFFYGRSMIEIDVVDARSVGHTTCVIAQ